MNVSGLDASHKGSRLQTQSRRPHDEAHGLGEINALRHHPQLRDSWADRELNTGVRGRKTALRSLQPSGTEGSPCGLPSSRRAIWDPSSHHTPRCQALPPSLDKQCEARCGKHKLRQAQTLRSLLQPVGLTPESPAEIGVHT